tara:strand:- start:4450 stop:5379 length:930 start_codon:yes stop_codon:yes gene_type:complete
MSFSTFTVNSNYAGQVAGEITGKAFKEASTLKENLVTVLPDIDFKISLRKIAYADGRVDYACGFTPTGTVTLSEKVLEPKKIMNQQELCKETLRQTWSSASMGFSAHNDNMPKDVETALLAEILGDTAEAVDKDIWQGDKTNTGEFDGFLKLFYADADVIQAGGGITSPNTAVTKTNVVSMIELVLENIPIALRGKTDLIVGISPDVAFFYEQALIAAGISNGLGGGAMELRYGNYVLTVINGLPANTLVAYERKNLFFGTSLMADHNSIRVKDQDELTLTGTVRYSMVYTAGVQYVNGTDIVWLLTTT